MREPDHPARKLTSMIKALALVGLAVTLHADVIFFPGYDAHEGQEAVRFQPATVGNPVFGISEITGRPVLFTSPADEELLCPDPDIVTGAAGGFQHLRILPDPEQTFWGILFALRAAPATTVPVRLTISWSLSSQHSTATFIRVLDPDQEQPFTIYRGTTGMVLTGIEITAEAPLAQVRGVRVQYSQPENIGGTPEPSTWLLAASSLGLFGWYRIRRSAA